MSNTRKTQPPLKADDPPRPTGRVAELELAGKVMPWSDGQPVFLTVANSAEPYLPLFDTEATLRRFLARAGVSFQSVKRVDNAREFLNSIPLTIRIITEPRFTERGTVVWWEAMRD